MDSNKHSHNARANNFEILENFKRFDQKNGIFTRSWWDKTIRSRKTKLFYSTYREPLKTWKEADGFSQKNYTEIKCYGSKST